MTKVILEDLLYCQTETKNIFEFSVELDLDQDHKLEMFKLNESENKLLCIKIENINTFISSVETYIVLNFLSLDSKQMNASILNFEVLEKKHKILDNEDISIPNSLTNELVQKINNLTYLINEGKNINDIYSKMQSLKILSDYLEVYSKNINSGIRNLNQYALNYLKNNDISIESNHKITKIYDHLQSLKAKQVNIFTRFENLNSILQNKKLLTKTRKSLKNINILIEKLTKDLNEDSFSSILNQSYKLVSFLEKSNVRSLRNKVKLKD